MDKKDITEMKSLTNPPQPVISVMSAFVILFEDDLKKE